jgi:hypothetical protein
MMNYGEITLSSKLYANVGREIHGVGQSCSGRDCIRTTSTRPAVQWTYSLARASDIFAGS